MNTPAFTVGLGVAVALLILGALLAFTSTNALKRVLAALVALFGAALALAFLNVPELALIAASAIAFSYCILGAAIVVRLQETYGSIEASALDAADEQDEPREPAV